MAEKAKDASEKPKDATETPKDAAEKAKDAAEKAKDGEKKEAEVDKDYVIFHFPGVEQLDGTSSGCETLKIPRESAIGLVKKVRPAVARLVERCPCNDPAPEPPEAVVPCVDCMAELKEEARRLSTQAMVQTPVSNMSLQQPCPFKPQSLTMMQNCPIPPHAPPMPDTITKQLSFIRITCGKCGAEQITDPAKGLPAKGAPAKAPDGAPAPKAAAGAAASTSGPCTGGTVNLAIPASNSHIQFTCKCLEQQQPTAAAGAPATSAPHAPNCCYGRGYPAPPRQNHHERARDRLLSEERRLTQRYELEDCALGRMSRAGRESYQELDESRVVGRRARGGIEEDDEEEDDRYALRRTSSGSVEVIGNDNYRVRVSVAGANPRSKRSVGR